MPWSHLSWCTSAQESFPNHPAWDSAGFYWVLSASPEVKFLFTCFAKLSSYCLSCVSVYPGHFSSRPVATHCLQDTANVPKPKADHECEKNHFVCVRMHRFMCMQVHVCGCTMHVCGGRRATVGSVPHIAFTLVYENRCSHCLGALHFS